MDMSLDDIIKTKKVAAPKTVKKGFISKKPAKSIGKLSSRPIIVDARNKIIQKNRAKIRDARDKLAEITRAGGDARLRLQRKHLISPSKGIHTASFKTRKPLVVKPKLPRTRMPNVIDIPRGYVDYDNMERMEEEEFATSSLRRTVKNDIVPPYTAPYGTSERHLEYTDSHFTTDPFDVYKIPSRRFDAMDDVNIRHQIRNMSPDLPPKGILRPSRHSSPPPFPSRRFQHEIDQSQLSYEMRSRLEHAPDPHTSMGIFSNPLKQQSSGYRIVVSNLHNSVSQSDIKELFEDIGELFEARLVRPGVSEVIFKNLKDAEKAVDTYHNRQLDGQPMKCLLVNPRSSNKPTAPAIKSNKEYFSGSSVRSSTSSSGKTPLEIDIDALHKVLFRRH